MMGWSTLKEVATSKVGVLILHNMLGLGGFLVLFSKFCEKIGKAKTHLAHALLIFQNKKLCFGISKKLFFFPQKQEKRRKKKHFLMKY
jgi:hypothetical protein